MKDFVRKQYAVVKLDTAAVFDTRDQAFKAADRLVHDYPGQAFAVAETVCVLVTDSQDRPAPDKIIPRYWRRS